MGVDHWGRPSPWVFSLLDSWVTDNRITKHCKLCSQLQVCKENKYLLQFQVNLTIIAVYNYITDRSESDQTSGSVLCRIYTRSNINAQRSWAPFGKPQNMTHAKFPTCPIFGIQGINANSNASYKMTKCTVMILYSKINLKRFQRGSNVDQHFPCIHTERILQWYRWKSFVYAIVLLFSGMWAPIANRKASWNTLRSRHQDGLQCSGCRTADRSKTSDSQFKKCSYTDDLQQLEI